MTTTPLDDALALLARGCSVIPVPRPGPGGDGKIPAIPWREFQMRRPTEAELRHWFATPMNVAIVTGAVSGLVVIDADSPEGLRCCVRRLPYTPWQTKTARGYHLFYQHPGRRIPNRARLDTSAGRVAVDVRGDGGYVIAPGSLHATGVRYTFAGDWTQPRDRVPRFWPGWLERRQARPARLHRTASLTTESLIERARRYLAAIPRPEIGQGSDAATLSAACRLVRGFDLTPTDAEMLLWEWAGGRAGWTRAWIAEKVAHAVRYGSEPIGALR
jgi:hypothetical protein